MLDESEIGRVVGADADLDVLFSQVAALRELASDPAQMQDSVRVYDFSIRWGTFLSGRLQRLAHYSGQGELDLSEHARYDALLEELRDAMPLVERLGLARPNVVLPEPATG